MHPLYQSSAGAGEASGIRASVRSCCRRLCCRRRVESHDSRIAESFMTHGTDATQGQSFDGGVAGQTFPSSSHAAAHAAAAPVPASAEPAPGLAPAEVSEASASTATGTEEQAHAGSPSGHSKGQRVHVWSNSKKRWFNDGIVVDIASTDFKDKGKDDRVMKVLPGSIKVRFHGSESKWLNGSAASEQLRRLDDRSGYGWREMRPHDLVPDRAVWTGSTWTDGAVCVACSPAGEPGKLALDASEEGSYRMSRIWCAEGNDSENGYALVLEVLSAARWTQVSAGDDVPLGAVPARTSPDGQQVYIARNKDGEAGKLVAQNRRVVEIACHHGKSVKTGDVLVVVPVERELEVEVLSVAALGAPKYRPMDGMRALGHRMMQESSLVPYIKLQFGDETWSSCPRRLTASGDEEHAISERAYFPVPDASAAPAALSVKVKDKRLLGGKLVGDPTIGNCSVEGAALDATEVRTLELQRDGRCQGRVTLRVCWHGGRAGAP